MSSSESNQSDMSVALLNQILARHKDVSAVTHNLQQESVSQSASLMKANAEAAESGVQDREAQAQTANLIRIQFEKVEREIASRSGSGSSGRSSPKSAMSEKSQICSEMGEPTDTDDVQVVLGENAGCDGGNAPVRSVGTDG